MSYRVVLADDVAPLRKLVRFVLEQEGKFQVVAEAGDGIEAVAAVNEVLPDLVLLDLSMPRMDGLEALKKIKRAHPELRVVLFSGYTAERMSTVGMDMGAAGYIEKGMAPAELITTLQAIMVSPPP